MEGTKTLNITLTDRDAAILEKALITYRERMLHSLQEIRILREKINMECAPTDPQPEPDVEPPKDGAVSEAPAKDIVIPVPELGTSVRSVYDTPEPSLVTTEDPPIATEPQPEGADTDLAQWIKDLRKRSGFSITKFTKRLDVAESSYYRWVSGKGVSDADSIAKLKRLEESILGTPGPGSSSVSGWQETVPSPEKTYAENLTFYAPIYTVLAVILDPDQDISQLKGLEGPLTEEVADAIRACCAQMIRAVKEFSKHNAPSKRALLIEEINNEILLNSHHGNVLIRPGKPITWPRKKG